jgi:redox-sensitive bicupin YhaK (pirin superfamily)
MKSIFRAGSRGVTRIEWLTSYHSFSFGNYFDPSKINFGPLRVINDDYIEPGGGFPTHPHNNMEIITLVLEGALAHADSTGNEEVIRYGEIQKMSAGRGILHSEFNGSDSERVHLLQIWIVPDKAGLDPYYETIKFSPSDIKNNLFKIAGRKGDNSVYINQDAELFLAEFDKGKTFSYTVNDTRQVYIHVIDGEIEIDGSVLTAGDAYAVDEPASINFGFNSNSRFILFDLIND